MKKLIPLLFLVFLTTACSDNGPTSVGDKIGEPAPDFTYTSLDGESVTLSQQNGKVVYLFFFGANCPHCRANGPVTETRIYQEFDDNPNFVALGLDTWNTSASSVNNFKSITGISYPLLLNAQQSLIDYYGDSGSYDRSVVIAADGTIAYQGNVFVNQDTDIVIDVIQKELAKL